MYNFLVSGTIVVFTGILPIAHHEHGLAAILGHGKSFHSAYFAIAIPPFSYTHTPLPGIVEIGHVGELVKRGVGRFGCMPNLGSVLQWHAM